MTPLHHDQSALGYVLARAAAPHVYERWALQGRSARWCNHPIRLSGTTTTLDPDSGEILGRYSTRAEPDGVLVKACGQRRVTACPQCAEVYRADAWHLLVAGLQGGKGVAPTVSAHPMIFITLTAPSFGAVHSRREQSGRARPCRTGTARPCSHGRTRGCKTIHESDDEHLGDPLCPDCFDYRAAVIWNALATELWRRTTIATTRALAAQAGVTITALSRVARLSYVKVVEYQRRGVIHLHVVARLDGATGPETAPPISIDFLERALRQAATAARVPYPPGSGLTGAARWGAEIDVRPVAPEGVQAGAIAAYIAKYATKSTDAIGRLDHKLKPSDLAALDLRPHLARLVTTAWDLGGRPELAHLRLRDWAHTLGFRGHWLTKSRRYSTTFAALRGARTAWTRQGPAPQPESSETAVVKDWRYLGRGWANPGDTWLAETAAEELTETRRLAREAGRQESPPIRLGRMTAMTLAEFPDVGRVEHVAAVLDCSKWCVYDLIANGDLKAIRLGRALRVTRRSLEEFLVN